MRCASNLSCGASYAAPLHTLAEEYCGVPEPSLTLAKGLPGAVRLGRARDTSCFSSARCPTKVLSTRLHDLLEVSLDWILLKFEFPRFCRKHPAR